MRIYIKPPYTDKNVEDSSHDGDDIVDVYDDMTWQGRSQSVRPYTELHGQLLNVTTWLR
jgi:hypothetical protein